MNAYKFFRAGAVAPFSGLTWPIPSGGNPGVWVEAGDTPELCRSGIHACRLGDLPHWLADELWRIELGGEILEARDTVVARRGRLLERVEGWNEGAAGEFAEACAWRARDHAVAELRLADLGEQAWSLRRASTLPAVVEAARAGCTAAEKAGAGRARAVADAAMSAAEHASVARGTPAHVSWVAFAGYGAAVAAGLRSPGGDRDERARQADWLAERLGL